MIPKELLELARQKHAENGFEETPEEFERTSTEVFATLRTEMRRQGFPVPDDDLSFIQMIAIAMEGRWDQLMEYRDDDS